MTDLRAAAMMALERLRKYHHGNGFVEDAECIAALEAALAQQGELVATVAENATTQQRVVETPPSDYRRGYWDGFSIGKREGRIDAEDALAQQDEATGKSFLQVAPVQEPVAWIQPDHLQKARIAPFLCRVEPTQRCADFVPLYTAPPQRKPLTEEEILKAIGWERAEMYMKLTPNFPVAEAKKETLKNARAIERAHGIGEQP